MDPAYKRILLKLSGEALMGEQSYGIDPAVATQIARDISEIQGMGVEVAMHIAAADPKWVRREAVTDQSLACRAPRFFRGGGEPSLAQNRVRFGEVAVRLGERGLALHHPDAGLVPELLHIGCGNRRHLRMRNLVSW